MLVLNQANAPLRFLLNPTESNFFHIKGDLFYLEKITEICVITYHKNKKTHCKTWAFEIRLRMIFCFSEHSIAPRWYIFCRLFLINYQFGIMMILLRNLWEEEEKIFCKYYIFCNRCCRETNKTVQEAELSFFDLWPTSAFTFYFLFSWANPDNS